MKARRRLLNPTLLLLALLTGLGPAGLAAQAPPAPPAPAPAPVNLDFEEGELGQVPAGWTFGRRASQAGYAAALVDEKPRAGSRCVRIEKDGQGGSPWTAGELVQVLDATPYRGKRVRLRGAVRFEAAGGNGNGRMMVRIDRAGGRFGFNDFMADRPFTSPDWTAADLTADVEPDAVRITFGVSLVGSGRLWADSLSLEAIGEAGAGNEPARALAGRGLENLAAFTRLLGYVRYFHPSDQAAQAHWERVAVAGVQAAEGARDAADLARRLEDFFRPLAPTVRVYPTGGRPASPAGLARPAGASPRVVAWKHFGVDTRANPSYLYWSRRLNNQEPAEPRQPSYLHREADATSVRGKKIRLRALVRAQVDAGKGEAPGQMFLGIYGDPGPGFYDDGKARPIAAGEWQSREIVADVPAGAARLSFGFHLPNGGRLWIDDLDFEVIGTAGEEAKSGEAKSAGLLPDPGFEQGAAGSAPDGWRLSSRDSSGYSAVIQSGHGGEAGKGRQSLLYGYTPPAPPTLPRPEEVFQADLPGGVSVSLPVALYADASGTLPRPPAGLAAPQPAKPEGFPYSGNDRATRLAGVALAWNVFQHFYPYFDVVRTDWPETLRRSLRSAATDPDADAFAATLQRLVADLQDGHGGVSGTGSVGSHRLPLIFDVVEDRLVVAYADPEKAPGVERGSLVLSVNGRPAREVMDEAFSRISAATPGWRNWRLAETLASGVEDEEVRLELQSPAGKVSAVSVRRVLPVGAQPRLKEPRPDKLAEIRPGIFYLDVERLSETELTAALGQLAAARGVIVDVRGYPQLSPALLGHLMDTAGTSAQWQVPVVARPDREGMTFNLSNWPVEPEAPRFKGKVAFLTDGRAISYAETFLGIAEHYKLGAIVGTPTAGTNGNINPFTLPGGYNLSWTGMKVLKHDGARLHGVGILPTVPVSRTREGVIAGRDEILEKALEIVSR